MEISYPELPQKEKRHFIAEDLNFDSWEALQPVYNELKARSLGSTGELNDWLTDMSELESAIQEYAGWLYIRMTCNTQNKQATDAYVHFVNEIQPKIAPYEDELNRKFNACSFKQDLSADYNNYKIAVDNSIRLFREKNIPLQAELQVKEQKYGETSGAMTVEMEGKTLTLQQASNFLKDPDREKRKEVFRKIAARRQVDRVKLDELFNELVRLRNTLAVNADFSNYRDYKFVELDRSDYTAEDCRKFHQSVQECVVPLLDALYASRASDMKLEKLKPWDLDADPEGRPDLKPFASAQDLIEKTKKCFREIDPYFGEVVDVLNGLHHLDLDSRIGKAPGGYNYPLYEIGVPFIFMNSSGLLRDVITMVHEGGHAIHSMLTRDLGFVAFKELPSEVAELASMRMELISMEHWHHFLPDAEELKRAKREQLENVIEGLPWIAAIDKFQHWLYLNPSHSVSERTAAWKEIFNAFSSSVVDWNEDTDARDSWWQKQLHLFEVPFYYIEYGMAQLGAIAVWRNYKTNPQKTIEQYKNALKAGSTRTIPEIYALAGIRFDFSESYIRELTEFVHAELKKL